MIHIIIANYKPEFSDGRVQRVSGLEEYLSNANIDYVVSSFGSTASKNRNVRKYTSFVLRYFHQVNNSQAPLKPSFSLKIALRSFIKKFFLKACIPDVFIFDVILNYRKMRAHVQDNSIVIISVPWFSPLLYSGIFRNSHLILDFRDLYIGNKTFSTIALFDKFLFNFAVRHSNEIWVTTQAAKNSLDSMVEIPVQVVPNGVSPTVISEILPRTHETLKEDTNLTIGYFGNLGGQRIFTNFFERLIAYKEVDLIGAGNFDEAHSAVFRSAYLGFLSKSELYQTMASCDLILVCITSTEHAEFAIPAKIYEGLCFGCPIILNAPPNSAAQNLLEEIDYPFLLLNSSSDVQLETLHELATKRSEPIIFDRSLIFKKALSFSIESTAANN